MNCRLSQDDFSIEAHDSLKGLQEKHFSVKLPRFLAIRIFNNPSI